MKKGRIQKLNRCFPETRVPTTFFMNISWNFIYHDERKLFLKIKHSLLFVFSFHSPRSPQSPHIEIHSKVESVNSRDSLSCLINWTNYLFLCPLSMMNSHPHALLSSQILFFSSDFLTSHVSTQSSHFFSVSLFLCLLSCFMARSSALSHPPVCCTAHRSIS